MHQFDVATEFVEQLLVMARTDGEPLGLARALNLQGRILIEQGALDQAETVLHENAQLARQLPHRFNPGCPLAQLGEIALARGDWTNAAHHLQEALALLTRAEGNLYTGIFVAMTHTDLAELALVHNDPTQARQELAQALPYARQYLRRLHCLLVTLVGLMVTSSPSATVQAATLLGAIAGLESRTGDTLSPFHQRLIAERMSHVRQRLSQQQWDDAWHIGYGRTPVQLIDDAAQWLGMETPNQPAERSNFPIG